jgi:hypothetical protein
MRVSEAVTRPPDTVSVLLVQDATLLPFNAVVPAPETVTFFDAPVIALEIVSVRPDATDHG